MSELKLATPLLDEHEIAQVILDNCPISHDQWSLKPLKNHRPMFHAAHRYGHENYQAIMTAFRTESWLTTIRNWNPEDWTFRVQQCKRRQRIAAVAQSVAESERWKFEKLLGVPAAQARSA